MDVRNMGKRGGVRRYLGWAAGALVVLGLLTLPAAGQDPLRDQTHWQTAAASYRELPSETTSILLSLVGTAASVASVFSWRYLGYVTLVPGASVFDHATSFTMIRGGHLTHAVIGAIEFPKPKSGGEVAVKYPLTFRPAP